jgi:hypothetical protein
MNFHFVNSYFSSPTTTPKGKNSGSQVSYATLQELSIGVLKILYGCIIVDLFVKHDKNLPRFPLCLGTPLGYILPHAHRNSWTSVTHSSHTKYRTEFRPKWAKVAKLQNRWIAESLNRKVQARKWVLDLGRVPNHAQWKALTSRKIANCKMYLKRTTCPPEHLSQNQESRLPLLSRTKYEPDDPGPQKSDLCIVDGANARPVNFIVLRFGRLEVALRVVDAIASLCMSASISTNSRS